MWDEFLQQCLCCEWVWIEMDFFENVLFKKKIITKTTTRLYFVGGGRCLYTLILMNIFIYDDSFRRGWKRRWESSSIAMIAHVCRVLKFCRRVKARVSKLHAGRVRKRVLFYSYWVWKNIFFFTFNFFFCIY